MGRAPSLDARTLTLGGTDYSVLFTARARFLFEDLAGYACTALHVFQDAYRPSTRELVWLLVAGLEGARLREERPERRRPWTQDVVIDLLDDATPEECSGALVACVNALGSALGGVQPDATTDPEASDGAGKAPATAG